MSIKTDTEKCLAEQPHSMHCRWDHADGCDWMYRGWTDDEKDLMSSRKEYLAKARRLVKECESLEIRPKDMIAHLSLVGLVLRI